MTDGRSPLLPLVCSSLKAQDMKEEFNKGMKNLRKKNFQKSCK
jgi:hypothetical protein